MQQTPQSEAHRLGTGHALHGSALSEGLRKADLDVTLDLVGPARHSARVQKGQGKFNQKIWLDVGTREGDEPDTCVRNLRDLKDALILRGWELESDLKFVEDEGAGHDEKAWGFRMREALLFFSLLRTRQRVAHRQTEPANFSPKCCVG
jgi:hypothetical protein